MEPERKKKRSRMEIVKCSASDILFANEFPDEFLINAVRSRVSVKQLEHKYVGLLFAELSPCVELPFLRALKQVYDQLSTRYPGAFEIVFVPFIDVDLGHFRNCFKRLFDAYLNQMPWLAVPYNNSAWRKQILDKYYPKIKPKSYNLLLFDPFGRLLEESIGLYNLVEVFGSDYYPFTKARQDELISQYLAPIRAKSLIDLLGSSGHSSCSPPRDYLISYSDGDDDYKKVPISQLYRERKLLGLFFYRGFNDESDLLFIERLYQFHLQSSNEFQIVLVNDYFSDGFQDEATFRDFLRERPWMLALPFEDEKIRSLFYTLAAGFKECNPLAIIGASDDCFSDPYGHEVIQQYGYEAYPFTQDMAVQIEKNKLFQVNVNDILKAIGDKYLVSIRGSKKKMKPISCLKNKRVIVCVGSLSCPSDIEKLLKLHDMDNSFEVLFLRNRDDRENLDLSAMPKWLYFPTYWFDYILLKDITKTSVYKRHFIAFDEDGKLVKIGPMELLEKDDCDTTFPFMTDKAFNEDFKTGLLRQKEWYFKDGDYMFS